MELWKECRVIFRMESDDDRFALKTAIVNAVGYCLTVFIISYVDPRLASHVHYGARIYRYGYFSALLGLPIFAITSWALHRSTTRGWRCLASCAGLVGVATCPYQKFHRPFNTYT